MQTEVKMEKAKEAAEFRNACRAGRFQSPTFSAVPGNIQANLVILPKNYGVDFEKFCRLNSEACPIVEILWNGPFTSRVAAGADVRKDLPKYRENRNVPMYQTNRQCTPFGLYHGNLVVSMRPYSRDKMDQVIQTTLKYPKVHGGPVAWGDPSQLGIEDLSKPSFGDSVTIKDDEIPLYWACGVTPQVVAMQSKLPLCITHAPGHMLVCDLTIDDLIENH